MLMWTFLATIIFPILILAVHTYRAGLPIFSVLVAVPGIAGAILIGLEKWEIGLSLFVFAFLMKEVSRHLMKKYKVGPFATATEK